MKVLVTGATGFTGSRVVPLLLQQRHEVRCLIRPSSDRSRLPAERIELVEGNLGDRASLERALRDVDTLVNVASLGFGHAQNIVSAAQAESVRRAVFLSTTAVFTTIDAGSKSVRLAAEVMIQRSGLAYTILRPTMIYGGSRDRNMYRLIRYLKRWPIIPVFGNGEWLQQPVYVGDVAAAVVNVLESSPTIGRCYNLGGAAPLTYNQVIDTVCELTGRRVQKIHLPIGPVAKVLASLERLFVRLPIKAEQVMRLNENKAYDFTEATRDFGYCPRPFAEGIRLELQELADHG